MDLARYQVTKTLPAFARAFAQCYLHGAIHLCPLVSAASDLNLCQMVS